MPRYIPYIQNYVWNAVYIYNKVYLKFKFVTLFCFPTHQRDKSITKTKIITKKYKTATRVIKQKLGYNHTNLIKRFVPVSLLLLLFLLFYLFLTLPYNHQTEYRSDTVAIVAFLLEKFKYIYKHKLELQQNLQHTQQFIFISCNRVHLKLQWLYDEQTPTNNFRYIDNKHLHFITHTYTNAVRTSSSVITPIQTQT